MQISVSVAVFVLARFARGATSACASRPGEGVKVKEVEILMGVRRHIIMQTFIHARIDKDECVAAIDLFTLTNLDLIRRTTIVLKMDGLHIWA